MNTIYQDVTITLDITKMSKEEYTRLTKILKALGEGKYETYTYTKDSDQNFSKEQQEQIDAII